MNFIKRLERSALETKYMNAEYLTFLRELPKSFSQIGAMLPSSPALGRAMVRPIREATRPLNILEVGPGTGPFTKQILKLMRPEDHFTICEINTRFLTLLKKNLARNEHFRRNKDRITFFHGPVQELPGSPLFAGSYDIIVSSLPFSNFSPEMVDEILSLFQSMLAEDGSLSFIEYIAVRRVTALLSSRRSRARLVGVEKVIQGWIDRAGTDGKVRKRVSLLNVPPAVAIEFDYQHRLSA